MDSKNKYYLEENNKSEGPFTLADLKAKNIKKSTLVWTEGFENWIPAENIEEVKVLILAEPPSLPARKETNGSESWAIKLGIILLFVSVITGLGAKFYPPDKFTFLFFATASVVIRIVIMKNIVQLADRLRRNYVLWGWIGFLFPSLTLIILGLLNKNENL